ncbi:hypothetical protein, partial [Enterobacter hormaechei]|uniref:hypothetical protein n=1 Tax=Enterobacter hormaechei TaxID=158836 RepID=UPI00203A771F
EWIPNEQGGRENLQAVAFLRRMNQTLRERFPDVLAMNRIAPQVLQGVVHPALVPFVGET